MQKKHVIEFVETRSPIREAVTKFGGQPVWVSKPEWPLSRATGNPMRFIGQIALDVELFGATGPTMGYLFMTDEDEFIDGTWEPDSGENAVILQPGRTSSPVTELYSGPTLYRMVETASRDKLVPEPCEFAVKLIRSEDPEFVPEDERFDWPDSQMEEHAELLEGNKIGGTPGFLQADEFPGPGVWKLLLQLDETRVPFSINFGDAGIGYAFLSDDGAVAKFLWQCS